MTLDFVFRKCTGMTPEAFMENSQLDWYDSYADGRDAGKGILVANWNHFPRLAAGQWPRTAESEAAQEYNWSRKGRRFGDILERLGYQLEWSDQVSRCDDCNGCIQTEPDCYSWTPEYHVFDSYILCAKCIKHNPAEYLADIEDNPRKAVFSWLDPEQHGYTEIKSGFESGWYSGQTDDPRKIKTDLESKGYEGILFRVDETGQFDMRFSVYARVVPGVDE